MRLRKSADFNISENNGRIEMYGKFINVLGEIREMVQSEGFDISQIERLNDERLPYNIIVRETYINIICKDIHPFSEEYENCSCMAIMSFNEDCTINTERTVENIDEVIESIHCRIASMEWENKNMDNIFNRLVGITDGIDYIVAVFPQNTAKCILSSVERIINEYMSKL